MAPLATWNQVSAYTWDQVATGTWDNPLSFSFVQPLTITPTLTVAAFRGQFVTTNLIATPTLTIHANLTISDPSVYLVATPTLLAQANVRRKLPDTAFIHYPYPQQKQHPFRLIAQEILSRKFVDWDLPVQDGFSYTTQLSGPSVMQGSFLPEVSSIQQLGLDGYAYFLHVEISGEIRATGIFLPPQHQEASLTFSCEGFSSISHYVVWGGQISSIDIDPLNVVRSIWQNVQNNPRSNLGIVISDTTSAKRLGTPAHTEIIKNSDGTTSINEVDAAPYELLWWNTPNCGDEIDRLSHEAPFDYRERVQWNAAKTDVELYLDLGYPRIGTPRDKLLFNEENVLEVVPVQEGDETYASEVIVIGSGEGSATIRGYAAEPFGNRVRKVSVITDKTVTTVDAANALAMKELGARKGSVFSLSEMVIHARHENASIGEYDIGDDIFVQLEIPWLPNLYTEWYRILSISYVPASEIIRLSVARSASFTYPSTTPPSTTIPKYTDDVQAAQLIMDQMKSGGDISEDWTWIGCPQIVSDWNDYLISAYIRSGHTYNFPDDIPDVVTWLQAYIIARI